VLEGLKIEIPQGKTGEENEMISFTEVQQNLKASVFNI
jgi:hypothetical protein